MKKIVTKCFLLFIIGTCMATNSLANNIQLANISLTGQNTSSDYTMIQFDISWENSWRSSTGPSNWDAAWIFVKYRIGSGPWLHAFLNNSGHSTGTGTSGTITPGLMNTSNAYNSTTNPVMGVFLHRNLNGIGTFSQTGLQLSWNYGANNVSDGEAVDVKVFAVEMVYVPSGSFRVGETSTSNIEGQFRDGATNTPFTISSEAAITLGGTTAGNLASNNSAGMAAGDDFNNSATVSLPASFPKGYNAFYCMKYEISQQQWIDFFNDLDATQKTNRDITGGTYNNTGKATDAVLLRNNISWASGDATLNGGTFGNVACNFLSWMDGAAFADWASLRPMTELEFEKACRGTLTPISNEYAWGTTNITGATGISNSGTSYEIASNSDANVNYNNNSNVQGPLRVGSFATSSSTREQAGASYYGIMELSGNLWERTVSVGVSSGRNFTAPIHGDGLLTADGFCNISTWPGYETNKVSGALGAGFRGGSWAASTFFLRISDRYYASSQINFNAHNYGFRAVRSVP